MRNVDYNQRYIINSARGIRIPTMVSMPPRPEIPFFPLIRNKPEMAIRINPKAYISENQVLTRYIFNQFFLVGTLKTGRLRILVSCMLPSCMLTVICPPFR